jgi:phosphate transport system permease protein
MELIDVHLVVTGEIPVVQPVPTPSGARDSEPAAEIQRVRKVSGLTRDERVEYAIALASGVHLAVLIRMLLSWDDLMGTAMVALISFVLAHFLLVRHRSTPDVAIDRAVTTLMWTIGVAIMAVLSWMVGFVAVKGISKLNFTFLTSDLRTVSALDEGGGAYHAMIGSFQQVGIATLLVVPVSILTAVYLHEVQGRMSKLIRFVVDVLAGMPSIVAGLLIITIMPGYAGYKASLALFILALPIVTRTSEEVLRTVPDGLREASLALGAPQWRVVMQVVLPTARAGLLTAVLLAVARMAGETAPVILTAFGATATNYSPFNGPQASLPFFVWDLIKVPDKVQNDRAWAGALLLLILVLVAFSAARISLARSERRLGRR